MENSDELAGCLRDFKAGGYPVEQVRQVVCPACGGTTFDVLVDIEEEGCAAVTCTACQAQTPIADSEDYLDEAELGDCQCPCGGETFEAATGFAMTSDGADVRWISLGLRCVADGQVGVYLDWKIDYSPSRQLLDRQPGNW